MTKHWRRLGRQERTGGNIFPDEQLGGPRSRETKTFINHKALIAKTPELNDYYLNLILKGTPEVEAVKYAISEWKKKKTQ